MDLQQTRGSNVSEVDGNARLSCGARLKKKISPSIAKRKMTIGVKDRTGHVVVVISLGGHQSPRQFDLAGLAAAPLPPIGPTP